MAFRFRFARRTKTGAGVSHLNHDHVSENVTGDEEYHCECCGADVARGEAIRTETYGDLDPTKWQTLCCPDCGARLKTVFVGGDSADDG